MGVSRQLIWLTVEPPSPTIVTNWGARMGLFFVLRANTCKLGSQAWQMWCTHTRPMLKPVFAAEIYKKNGTPQDRNTRFVWACAVEMHMDMSQEPFYAEIYREHAGRPGYHLDWTPGPNPDRKNPKCGHTVGILVPQIFPNHPNLEKRPSIVSTVVKQPWWLGDPAFYEKPPTLW